MHLEPKEKSIWRYAVTDEKIREFKANWEKREGKELSHEYIARRVEITTDYIHTLCVYVIREELKKYDEIYQSRSKIDKV
jgi:hypothetical protein